MTSSPSEAGRALAALRPRATYTCEVCGAAFEAWARDRQKPATCSQACRQKRWRQSRKPEVQR